MLIGDGRVDRDDRHPAPVDAREPGHDGVSRRELGPAQLRLGEQPELAPRALVDQLVDPFSCGQTPRLMMALDPFRAAHRQRPGSPLLEVLYRAVGDRLVGRLS